MIVAASSVSSSSFRAPRFRRPALRADVRPTDRDLQIFSLFLLHRFLRAPDIARLIAPDAPACVGCAGSGKVLDAVRGEEVHHVLCRGTGRQGYKSIFDRIGLLFSAGYLDRPPYQLDYYRAGGSSRIVYALANAGARALMRHGKLALQARVDFGYRNEHATKHFIHHALDIADLSVALTMAVRRHKEKICR